MNSKIVETLETMCDKDNPQDRKLLLLAELVETKCDALATNQKQLMDKLTDTKESLIETSGKLDRLTKVLESTNSQANSCPVHKNKEGFDRLSVVMKYPKLTLFAVVGFIAILAGAISNGLLDLLKMLFGL